MDDSRSVVRNFFDGSVLLMLNGFIVCIFIMFFDILTLEFNDSAIRLGKYIVKDPRADCYTRVIGSDEIVYAELNIVFAIEHVDNEIVGTKAADTISDIFIDGVKVNSSVESLDDVEWPEGDGDEIALFDYVKANYEISMEQYYAFKENGKELEFTVTLAGNSVVYTLTYDKSKEGWFSNPITAKIKRNS